MFILLGALVAYLIIRRVTGMKMTRQTVMDDLSMLRRSDPSPNGSGPTATNPQVGARDYSRDPARATERQRERLMPAEPVIQIAGPWTHRSVTANGSRFHVASMGEGPLVLLLHGFPEFWWTWRRQLVTLSEAGDRAVAVDLRGYGGSDKPPRGYDQITAAADAAGLIRALGEANAIIVGHDWGGLTAWTLALVLPQGGAQARRRLRGPSPADARPGCCRTRSHRALAE